MINCAHPTHFDGALRAASAWVRAHRAACAPTPRRRSHAELDEAPELDAGDPVELGRQYRELLRRHPQINVLGGCCGTDHRHVGAICGACVA